MSLIYRHAPTGGKLYQCGAREIPDLLTEKEIDLLILAAKEYQPRHLRKHDDLFKATDRLHVPFRDSSKMPLLELKEVIRKAKRAANHGIHTILQGGNVLSTCWAGLNRSGLISGLIVKKLANCSGDTAIELIRKNRSEYALFNPLFVQQIRST